MKMMTLPVALVVLPGIVVHAGGERVVVVSTW
jgi:hypothetical protein